MNSPVYPKESRLALTMSRRILLYFLASCIQMIYIPTSNQVSGGLEPKLPIDIFPLLPLWVLPYMLCYVLWFASLTWILLKAEDQQFRSFIAACILTFALGASTFIFFPTYVKPAPISGNGLFSSLPRVFHEQTGRYAALPSGHVYITTLLALFISHWYPRYRWIWITILIIVSLSTLLPDSTIFSMCWADILLRLQDIILDSGG